MPLPDIVRIEGSCFLKNLLTNRIFLRPYIIVTVRIVFSFLRFNEPRMKIARVINDKIRYDFNAALMRFFYKYFKVINGSVVRINVFIIDNVILVISI